MVRCAGQRVRRTSMYRYSQADQLGDRERITRYMIERRVPTNRRDAKDFCALLSQDDCNGVIVARVAINDNSRFAGLRHICDTGQSLRSSLCHDTARGRSAICPILLRKLL